MRYSPRAVPTRLARPARLYGTTLAANSFYVCSRHAQAPHGSRTHGGYVPVCQYVDLSYFVLSYLVAKPRYLSWGDFLRFDPKVSMMFALGTFLFAGLYCITPPGNIKTDCTLIFNLNGHSIGESGMSVVGRDKHFFAGFIFVLPQKYFIGDATRATAAVSI